jgi:hypothetical protein
VIAPFCETVVLLMSGALPPEVLETETVLTVFAPFFTVAKQVPAVL